MTSLQEALAEHIAKIRAANKLGIISPDIVRSFALLTMQDDKGYPIEFADFHLNWLELICDENIKKLLIIAPPGSAKTTVVMAYIGCRIGIFPNNSYIIGSVTDDVAEKRSLSLRNMIDSSMWKAIFPNIMKDATRKWEQKEWSIIRKNANRNVIHPTIRAYGTGASIVGSRADIMVGDDLLDMNNTATQGQREKVEEWMDTSFLSRRKPDGRVILIGTQWNSLDYYSKIRRENLGWVVSHVPLLGDNPFRMNVIYPDSWQRRILGERVGIQ